jgi:hypothetical protein
MVRSGWRSSSPENSTGGGDADRDIEHATCIHANPDAAIASSFTGALAPTTEIQAE